MASTSTMPHRDGTGHDEHRGERRHRARAMPAGTRRTVVIRGQIAPPRSARHPVGTTVVYPRRPPRPLLERFGTRPDRAAMWAFVLGVFLVIVAALSAHP